MIRKVAFPHEIVVLASVAATFALQFAGYVAVLVVLSVAGEPIHLAGLVVAIPVWLVLAGRRRGHRRSRSPRCRCSCSDVEHVLMPVLMILMYLTPILYPLSLVPESLRSLGRRESVQLARRRACAKRCSTGGSRAVRPTRSRVVVALLLFVGGRWVFRRLSPHFEDFV